MTVHELIEKLQEAPSQDLPVVLHLPECHLHNTNDGLFCDVAKMEDFSDMVSLRLGAEHI